MGLVFSNHAETQLATPLLATDLTMTLPVGEAALFRSLNVGESELVVITDGVAFETVEVTAWAGDVATITRGVESTAQAWATGTIVSARITAKAFELMLQRTELNAAVNQAVVLALAGGGGGGGGASVGAVKSNVVELPDSASFDMASYEADLTTIPEIFLIPTFTIPKVVTLPRLTNLLIGQVVEVRFVREYIGYNSSLIITPTATANETYRGTLGGSTTFSGSSVTFRGYKKLDGTGHWV